MLQNQTSINDDRILTFLRAGEMGARYAAELQPGSLFIGCGPEAKRLYPNDRGAQRLFIHYAMDRLEQMDIRTDCDGRIISIRSRA